MSHEQEGPAYAGFEGRVGRTFAGSQGWWPPRSTPPVGAPNVVVILADDLGYADLGCFGSEIETPNLDRLAGAGLAYSNFHVTPMCSPTRASLLTGVQHHLAGFGTVAHSDAGFPGYAMELPATTATLPEILGAQGYATFMVGKWHLAKDSDISAAGPQHSWPCQRGFDRFYGFLDAFTNLHQPHRLTEDNHQVLVDRYPDDFYLTDDLTDHAVGMIRESKASNPDQPFFLYFAHGAVHAPLHAKAGDIARYRGRYDAGWDELRRRRHARQLELGVIPPGTPLAPRNTETDHDVIPWDELSDQERELFARHMEVYAAMVDGVDQSVGHLLDALEELGERDNTIVIFLSDNGGSREGEVTGTSSYYVHLLQGDDVEADRARIDLLGGPQTTPHYPRGWAMASNTPWRLYKINTHAGGHTVPFIMSWPGGGLGGSAGSGWRRQYTHVTDLLPTLCELVGIEPDRRRTDPARPEVASEPLPLAGSSFVDTLADPDTPSGHHTTVEEMNGHRGLYHDGWEVVTLHQPLTPFDDEEWELYDLERDPVELEDRATAEPARRAEMIEAWEREAWANQIYPLDEGSAIRYLIRPERSDVFRQPVRIVAGTPSLERWRSVQLIWFRSATIIVELDYAPGDQGILVAHGDQGGGYALYVLDGELRFVHNDGRGRLRRTSGGTVPAGARRLEARLHAVGGGTWTVTLVVEGQHRGRLEGVPLLYGMAPFEGIDVGIDRRSPVDWELWQRFGPFPWTGRLEAVTYLPGEDAPDSPGNLMEVIRAMGQRFEWHAGSVAWTGAAQEDVMFGSRKLEVPTADQALPGRDTPMPIPATHYVNGRALAPPYPDGYESMVVGMGCFWGAEKAFWSLPGVWVTAAGYAGGTTPNPTYEEVCSGRTGHTEAVLIVFDPAQISYEALLKAFWEGHDPTQGMRQGNDVGTQYRSAIYTTTPSQLEQAQASAAAFGQRLADKGFGAISTEIAEDATFYFAEGYHQQYLAKNPDGYCGLGGTGVSCPIGLATAD